MVGRTCDDSENVTVTMLGVVGEVADVLFKEVGCLACCFTLASGSACSTRMGPKKGKAKKLAAGDHNDDKVSS